MSGLRRMKAAVPDATWGEVLPEVLAGLRQLRCRLGFQLAPACFQAVPQCAGVTHG